jgi:protein tyrosine phosphatase (PTP) superfamily phosphohydrolase (DUF442 family)
MKFNITLILSFLLLASCAQLKSNEKVTIADGLKASKYSNLYFSGQPTEADLRKLKRDGFAAVINLRPSHEHNEVKEKEILKQEKIAYINHPFSSNSKLTDKYITAVTKTVKKYKAKGKVLLHCSSGNRVGIWLGGHFFKDHEYSKEKSLKLAKELGLTKSGAINKVKDYLQSK